MDLALLILMHGLALTAYYSTNGSANPGIWAECDITKKGTDSPKSPWLML
jgi:hypothetical protein